MRAQELGYLVAVQAALLLEPHEERRHRIRVEMRPGHGADADAVGLQLVGAREVHFALVGGGLAERQGGDDDLGVGRGGDDRGEHRRPGGEVAALRALDRARDVALRDVGQLVRHDAGQLAFAAHRGQQARVDAEVAAGQGEGVDARVADHEHGELGRLGLGRRHQAPGQRRDVIADFGVLEDVVMRIQLRGDARADLFLLGRRQRHVGGLADARQVHGRGLGGGAHGAGQGENGEEKRREARHGGTARNGMEV